MAPEYATEGMFSEKSDVYSFGVLMLEIVKGQKNTHYYNRDWSLGLLGCVSFALSKNIRTSCPARLSRLIQIFVLICKI